VTSQSIVNAGITAYIYLTMPRPILVLILLSLGSVVFGQSYHEKFQSLFNGGGSDSDKIRSLLSEWEKTNPDDPELYTSAINFYFSNSKQTETSLSRKQSGKSSLQFTDSTGKVAGYMNSNTMYRPDQLVLAFRYIDMGIEKFPDRLDMRFGKCYVLGQIADYDGFTREIIKAVEYSTTNKNHWLWTDNKKLDNGEKFMLQTVQDYLKQLYDTENDSLLENMKRIGEVTIKYYPTNVEILSSTAVANMLTKNYDTALVYLKLAENLNPKDFIVLNNIAQGYKMKGDKANAIKYYELTEKYGDEEAKQQARKNLRELKSDVH
jgi:tetratricopeptide (TPR) repeat protein